MSSPTSFHRILCLVIFALLSSFVVVAKPIELPALQRARNTTKLSVVVVATVSAGGLRNELTFDVDNPQMPTLIFDTPACTHPIRDAPDCKTTDAVPTLNTITCSSLHHCHLNGESESVSTADSCNSHGVATEKLNALHPLLTDINVAPFLSAGNYDTSPVPFSEDPVVITTTQPAFEDNLPSSIVAAPGEEKTVTHTATIPQDQDGGISGSETTMAPQDKPDPVPGQKTVYVTVTEDPSTVSTSPTEPFSDKPLSTSHPESNKTAIILGSVFGSLAVLCISIVSMDRLRRLRRRKRELPEVPEESQECQKGQEGQKGQQCPDSVSSVEDMSELLRLQQQAYGYYGTQRVASSTIVPQQMKSFPTSSEPAELPTPKGDTVEKEHRDGH